jgi:uncharacterized protein
MPEQLHDVDVSPRSLVSLVRGEDAVLLLGATVLLTLDHYFARERVLRHWAFQTFGWTLSGATPRIAEFLAGVLLFSALPLALSWATKGNVHRRWGLSLGDVRFGVKATLPALAVIFPFVFAASRLRMFYSAYPLAGRVAFQASGAQAATDLDWRTFALYELCYVLYLAAWELFFRGWLLQGLAFKHGPKLSLLLTTALFVLCHWEKPAPEAFGAIVAGLLLGILALRTRSIWYGVLLHACAAVAMDVFAAQMRLRG